MKRIIVVGLMFLLMLISLGACYVDHGGYDRDRGYDGDREYDRDRGHDRDQGRDRGGEHEVGGWHEEQHEGR